MIGAGFLAVSVLTTSTAYALSEVFGWRYGLNEEPHRAKQFYGVIAATTAIGMLINYIGINPIDALVWASVINGVLAPPVLAIVMLIGKNREIMGERVNNAWMNVLGWTATAVMGAAAVALLVTLVG